MQMIKSLGASMALDRQKAASFVFSYILMLNYLQKPSFKISPLQALPVPHH